MDIISHALLGGAVVADRDLILPALLFGMGPDLLNGIPVYIGASRSLRKEGISWSTVWRLLHTPGHWQKAAPWTHTSYLYLHSLFPAILLTIAIYLLYPSWLTLMKAWFLHLGIDYITHKNWFTAKPLYPLSNWNIGLCNWFETPLKYGGALLSLGIFVKVYL